MPHSLKRKDIPLSNHPRPDEIHAAAVRAFAEHWEYVGRDNARRVCDFPEAGNRFPVFIASFIDAYCLGAQEFGRNDRLFPQRRSESFWSKLQKTAKVYLKGITSVFAYMFSQYDPINPENKKSKN
jgi:hypothetical protein